MRAAEKIAREKLARAMNSLAGTERLHDENRNAKTIADYRRDFCIAMAYVDICKNAMGIDVIAEDRLLDQHRPKCNAPFLEWNEA